MEKSCSGLDITPELLGLKDIKIDKITLARDNSIHIKVSSIKKQTACHKCGGPTHVHGRGRTLFLRHLPILGREVYIEITPPRGICHQCDDNPTTSQTLDWFKRNGHHTKPYDDYLMLQLIGSTLSDVAKKENLTEGILQRVIDPYQIDAVDWKSIKRIGLLGIDEIAKLKGHDNYITLVTSRYQGENKILGVIDGKEKASIKEFLCSIPNKKKKTITAVCVDLCDNYINAAKEALGTHVPIVADRFHVAKLYRKAITQLRSAELKRLRKVLSDEEYKALRPAIKILTSKNECYTKEDKKILSALFKLSSAIKSAYRLARELTHIYNTHHRKAKAQRKMKAWMEKMNNSGVDCLNTFVKTLVKYNEQVCNYFIRRCTSGWVEGINNKVKVLKRRCYGLTNIKHFFQRIFLDLQGYDVFLKKQEVSYQ